MNGPNGIASFDVAYSAIVLERLKELIKRSKKRKRLIANLRVIHSRLKRDARSFGEPIYVLAAMKMQIRISAYGSLAIQYGVYVEKPVVIVQRFTELG